MVYRAWISRALTVYSAMRPPCTAGRSNHSRSARGRFERLEPRALLAALSDPMVVGGVSDHAAKVFVRTDVPAQVAVQYSTSPSFALPQQTPAVTTSAGSDLTAIIGLEGLVADTKFYYRPVINGEVSASAPVHSFSTFPAPGGTHEFSFAILSDLYAATKPPRPAPAYEAAAANDPAFVMQIGDFDHRNPKTLSGMRAMHRQVRNNSSAEGADFAEHIAPSFPFFHVWDDHDYGMDDGDKTFAGRPAALQAFSEYFPTPDRPNPAGVWHSFEYAQAEIFMLDVRSQADPRRGPDGPDKSMLDGDNISNGQLSWLKQELLDSTATWKFLVSGVPFNPTTKPYDAWGAYARERQELLDFINAQEISGVVIISGDLHTGGAIDDGTNSGLPEISVPHTNLPSNLIASGTVGKWSKGFVSGVGGDGYSLITVRADGVLLESRGADGAVRQQLLLTTPGSTETSLAIAPASAVKSEGNSGSTLFTYTITRSGNASSATTVDYSTSGSGSSPADAADFGGVLPTGTINFAAGETTKTIGIAVAGDGDVEPDETFTVTLSNPTGGAQITTGSAVATIVNDDGTSSGGGLLGEYFNNIDLTGSAGTQVDATVNFPSDWGAKPAGTTVTADDKYSVRWSGFVEASTAGAWTFFTTSNDGVRLWIDDVPVINNWTKHNIVENSGTVSLSAGWHAIRLEYFQQGGVAEITLSYQGPGQGKTIIPQAKLSATGPTAAANMAIAAAQANQSEGNAGVTPFTFTITRSGNASDAATVSYTVAGLTTAPADAADFGGDFPGGVVSFAAGETTKTITLNVSGDTQVESDETFMVTLANPSGGAQISTGTATGRIVDDDFQSGSNGLLGEYFNGIDLTGPAGTRIDATVNFRSDWGAKPGGTNVVADDNYSVRWTGFVETSTAGAWTFFTTSNDGVRLWIDDVQVINNWTKHAVMQNATTVDLTPGWHAIRLEYFQQGGVAEMTLSYQGPGQGKAIIPQAKLSVAAPSGVAMPANAFLVPPETSGASGRRLAFAPLTRETLVDAPKTINHIARSAALDPSKAQYSTAAGPLRVLSPSQGSYSKIDDAFAAFRDTQFMNRLSVRGFWRP